MFLMPGDRAGRRSDRRISANLSLPKGTIQSEVLSAAGALSFYTKSNTGAQVLRLQIASGQTDANTQLTFINMGTANFSSMNCSNLASITSTGAGLGSVGTATTPWGTMSIINIIGGDDVNVSSFVMSVYDGGGGGTSSTLFTVPLTVSPLTATWSAYTNLYGVPNAISIDNEMVFYEDDMVFYY